MTLELVFTAVASAALALSVACLSEVSACLASSGSRASTSSTTLAPDTTGASLSLMTVSWVAIVFTASWCSAIARWVHSLSQK